LLRIEGKSGYHMIADNQGCLSHPGFVRLNQQYDGTVDERLSHPDVFIADLELAWRGGTVKPYKVGGLGFRYGFLHSGGIQCGERLKSRDFSNSGMSPNAGQNAASSSGIGPQRLLKPVPYSSYYPQPNANEDGGTGNLAGVGDRHDLGS
jgi:hypothetical protein